MPAPLSRAQFDDADGNDSGAAIGFQLDQRFVGARRSGELLVLLAVGQKDRLGLRYGFRHRPAVKLPHERARYEELARCRKPGRLDQPSQLCRHSMFDVDRVGLRARLDVNAKQCVK